MPSSVKGSNYLVKVNQSGVLVMVGGRRGHSFSYRKRINSYTTNQTSVFMFPKKSYIIRNMKVNNNSRLTISEVDVILEFPNLIDIWKDVVDLSVKIVREM